MNTTPIVVALSILLRLLFVLESAWPVKREISRLEKEVLKELDLDLEGEV